MSKDKIINQQLNLTARECEITFANTKEDRVRLWDEVKDLSAKLQPFEGAWVGNWVENTDVYLKNLKPTAGTYERMSVTEVKNRLKKVSGIDMQSWLSEFPKVSKQFFTLREFILSELAIIRSMENLENEIELLSQIDQFQWGSKPGEFVRMRRPRFAVVDNPSVLNDGFQTPPHISVGSDIVDSMSLLASYDNFEKLAKRLIRQLEIRFADAAPGEGTDRINDSLIAMIEKFHVVATQLKNRYNGRGTIVVNDEYDVQDLMNALLRMSFEDVRKEEYTPSYAGSSTRVDFLLKREKIIIEVKKTRSSMKDKDIGNQLISDIAHYKSHPDCKRLICFVYDPENLVSNPRGLEDDLNRMSAEEMLVEVFIRP